MKCPNCEGEKKIIEFKGRGLRQCACSECDGTGQVEDLICPQCNGSGEGMHDGTVCSFCHGTGVEQN